MNIVVTGGAGYIGSITAAILLEKGHNITVIDNLSRGFKEAVPTGAKFIEADIADIAKVVTPEDKIDAVVHLAAFAYVGESTQKPDIYWENNVVSTLRLLAGMRELGIQKLVFASTCATYGSPETLPIDESMPKNPINPYGMTKLAMDMAITGEANAYGLSAVSLRFFNVAGSYKAFGERHTPETHIIPLALAAANGDIEKFTLFGDDYPTKDGTCIRDYIHVTDLVYAMELALEHMKTGQHSIYNLGNGNGFSNREVVAAVEAVSGKKVPLEIANRRPGDPPTLIASSKLIHKELGWQPQRPNLQDMVKDAWEFYRTMTS